MLSFMVWYESADMNRSGPIRNDENKGVSLFYISFRFKPSMPIRLLAKELLIPMIHRYHFHECRIYPTAAVFIMSICLASEMQMSNIFDDVRHAWISAFDWVRDITQSTV